MYIYNIISKLDKSVLRIGNIDYYPADKVRHELDILKNVCIQWSVDDFESIAIRKRGSEWSEYYDKEHFGDALEEMIYRHDAEIGINWYTVEYYLDEICARKTTEAMQKDIYNGEKSGTK